MVLAQLEENRHVELINGLWGEYLRKMPYLLGLHGPLPPVLGVELGLSQFFHVVFSLLWREYFDELGQVDNHAFLDLVHVLQEVVEHGDELLLSEVRAENRSDLVQTECQGSSNFPAGVFHEEVVHGLKLFP